METCHTVTLDHFWLWISPRSMNRLLNHFIWRRLEIQNNRKGVTIFSYIFFSHGSLRYLRSIFDVVHNLHTNINIRSAHLRFRSIRDYSGVRTAQLLTVSPVCMTSVMTDLTKVDMIFWSILLRDSIKNNKIE